MGSSACDTSSVFDVLVDRLFPIRVLDIRLPTVKHTSPAPLIS